MLKYGRSSGTCAKAQTHVRAVIFFEFLLFSCTQLKRLSSPSLTSAPTFSCFLLAVQTLHVLKRQARKFHKTTLVSGSLKSPADTLLEKSSLSYTLHRYPPFGIETANRDSSQDPPPYVCEVPVKQDKGEQFAWVPYSPYLFTCMHVYAVRELSKFGTFFVLCQSLVNLYMAIQ